MSNATFIIATVREVVRERRIATIKLDTKRPSYLYLFNPPKDIEAIEGVRLQIDEDSIFVSDQLWATREDRHEIKLVARRVA